MPDRKTPSDAFHSPPPARTPRAALRIMIVSRHDYRTGRRASVHFLAQAMVAKGHAVRFVSVGYSWLSRLRRDSRASLADAANRWHIHDGVQVYLWKSPWHAVDLPLVGRHAGRLYDLWARLRCDALDAAAADSDVIIIESGIAPMLIARLRAAAPHARLVYRAADLLSTAGVHPRVQQVLARDAHLIDLVVVVARAMLPHFDHFPAPKLVLTHGVDRDRLHTPTRSPYAGPRNVVSVGAMLFDPDAVRQAAGALPDWTFHMIGTPPTSFPGNVRQHAEMPFAETLRYLHHADVGLAAYRRGPAADYLADSSLKLLQFGALGLPAVCPEFAVGGRALRFGYDPDDLSSVPAAIASAAAAARSPVATADWADVTDRLMEAVRG